MSNTASHFNDKKSDSWVSRSVRLCLAALCLSSTISNNPVSIDSQEKLIENTLKSWNLNRPFYSCVLSYLAMNASEAGGDLALIQTSLLFSCKCQLVNIRTT